MCGESAESRGVSVRVQTAMLALILSAAPVAELGSPARAVTVAHADAVRLGKTEAVHYRYLWISTPAGKQRDELLLAVLLHLNLLSSEADLARPDLIAPDLLRIDTRELGWGKRLHIWERFAAIDKVGFHTKLKLLRDATVAVVWPGGYDRDDGKDYEAGLYDAVKKKAGDVIDVPAFWLPPKEIEALRLLTLSEAPVLHAEWWFTQTARQISIRNKVEGVGYYEWHDLKTRDDFFRVTGTDPKLSAKLSREWRAIVDVSGISQQNRQIFALSGVTGRVWGTLDVFSQEGRGLAKRNLRKGEFLHDAEEWYGFLPNGLPVTFLADKAGVAQATAPDQIGPDDSPLRVGRDARIHANLSCLRCHGSDKDWLKPVDDWARRTFRRGGLLRLADLDKRVTLELKRQYLGELNEVLDDDRALYARAVRKLTVSKAHPRGLSIAQLTDAYCRTWNRYVEARLKLADAARELGVSAERLLAGIQRHAKVRGGTDLVLAAYLDDPPGELTRLEWEDSYALAMALALGVQPPEVIEEKKEP